jgi:hypothetical protein
MWADDAVAARAGAEFIPAPWLQPGGLRPTQASREHPHPGTIPIAMHDPGPSFLLRLIGSQKQSLAGD